MTRLRWRGPVAVLTTLLVAAVGCTVDDEFEQGAGADAGAESIGVEAGEQGYAAVIRRTTDGVPHVLADDFDGAVFGQGYASGQDHACALADQLLTITSTRAAALGPGEDDADVDSDFGWAATGLRERVAEEYPRQSEEIVDLVTAFAAGWNAHLDDVGVDGLEGWCAGAGWVRPLTPEDVYLWARAVTLLASGGAVVPYLGSATPPAATGPAEGEAAAASFVPAPVASNGWAIGGERSEGEGGMLLANPHFPWTGPLRFWEVHLTVPGELDVYGAQLVGLPGLAIGFSEGMAWTHTVSDGNRFTGYTLDLVPGRPTSYVKDGVEVPMTSEDVTVQVRRPDGSTEPVTRTLWSTEYGPVLDLPGFSWDGERAVTYRDANIDNDEFLPQYLDMARAEDLEELQAAHERHQGVPLFNTIAVGADGTAWYADTSATPNLSDEALAAYEERLATDPLTQLAEDNGVVLLDGSTSRDDWVVADGARDPGLVPYDGFPMTERSDYLFNANDSFWLPNAQHLLAGDYSFLHGRQDTVRSPRTRENAVVLDDTSADGPSGEDGRFDLAELRDAALQNRGYTSRALLADVVARCRTAAAPVEVPATAAPTGDDGAPLGAGLPATSVDVAPACEVLAAWDGSYDVGARGAVLWREFIGRFEDQSVWAEPFDAARPVETPSGLVAAPAEGSDPVLVNLGVAVQVLGAAGVALDAPLGEVQIDGRLPEERLPVPGGTGADGVTNIVGWGGGSGSSEEFPERPPTVVGRSGLTTDGTYWIRTGTSFLMAVEFTEDGPRASSILTYGQVDDPASPEYTSQVRRFAAKDWKPVLLTEEEIRADPAFSEQEVSG